MIAALAVFAMVFAAGAVLFESASSVDAEGAEPTAEIRGDTNLVKTGGSLTYRIMFFEPKEFDTLDLTFTASLKSNEKNDGSVSPGSGSLSNGIESTLTVKAPTTPGKYTLSVVFTERIDGKAAERIERTQTVTVVKPVVLTATLFNNSNVDFTDLIVYFHVDGKLIEESKTLVSVEAGERTNASYEWVTESLSNGKHTYRVVAGKENIGIVENVILGGEGTFYVGHSDYGLINILMGVLLVVVVIATIYFYRKPVKNYGKPKARR